MNNDILLIKFGELALKQGNRHLFEEQLMRNIRQTLRPFPGVTLQKTHGRLFVHLHDAEQKAVIEALQTVFGLVEICPVTRVPLDMDALRRAALALMEEHDQPETTFKVEARRSNKAFAYDSQQINRDVGGYVLKGTTELKVDVHRPTIRLSIEIRSRNAYVYCKSYPGLGGLPVGASGKAMLLLSGGIDSPVAGFLMMKRGVKVEAVHFHSPPYTSERALKKVEDLAHLLTTYGGQIKLHVVPFTEIQTQIKKHCRDSFSITVMRRFMLRITEKLAEKRRALALATGESVGQVASQTLESIRAINDVASLPILRPLISMDKQEIIALSKNIGTYGTSILPYDDCCTLFVPRSPQTRPDVERTRGNESGMDVEGLVEEAIRNTELKTFSAERRQEFSAYFD